MTRLRFSVLWIIASLQVMILIALAPRSAEACSAFLLRDSAGSIRIGKSYDWHSGHGMVFINARGWQKSAFHFDADQNHQPLRWQSRWGSVTLSQFSQDLPVSGINERGLTVEVLWLSETVYPPVNLKPRLNELHWIQYLLDTAATTREAIDVAERIDVWPIFAPIHYLVCDAAGHCAAFEYLEGQLIVHRSDDGSMPVRALTNNSYQESLEYLSEFEGFGGISPKPAPRQRDSLSRFVHLASEMVALDNESLWRASTLDLNAFDLLARVEVMNSQWQIVYDPQKVKVWMRQPVDFPHGSIQGIDLSGHDLSCHSAMSYIDIRGDFNVAWQWHQWSSDVNSQLLSEGNASLGGPFDPSALETVQRNLADRICQSP